MKGDTTLTKIPVQASVRVRCTCSCDKGLAFYGKYRCPLTSWRPEGGTNRGKEGKGDRLAWKLIKRPRRKAWEARDSRGRFFVRREKRGREVSLRPGSYWGGGRVKFCGCRCAALNSTNSRDLVGEGRFSPPFSFLSSADRPS